MRRAGSLPGFVVIGAQRGGTTTLFHSLLRHPMIGSPMRKEVHYFDSAYAPGELWYRSFFPGGRRMERNGQRLAGEATPSYLFHPLAAEPAADTLPEAKFVAVLRDPVARAWSHHAHQAALGYETLPFGAAIEAEAERLAGEEDRIRSDPAFQATRFRRVSYLARGDYAPQFERWFSAVGKDRVLVLVSESSSPILSRHSARSRDSWSCPLGGGGSDHGPLRARPRDQRDERRDAGATP